MNAQDGAIKTFEKVPVSKTSNRIASLDKFDGIKFCISIKDS